ncbi:MAG: hypothetical protein NZ949_03195 [Candidatus Kapabacteria bacterium]|nr:hypothetical protein [Candidatus Kapabacteria bacterium]
MYDTEKVKIMGIEPIRHGTTPPASGGTQPHTQKPVSKPPSPVTGEGQDTVELSPEAQQLQEAQHREGLGLIRQRLNSGFYSSQEVLQHVAQKILEELTQKSSR